MNAVNPVQLLILGWTFTAVCQADDDISVNCEDVTGTVGEEVTLTCSVSQSLECTKRCIKGYKFHYTEIHNKSEICKEEFPQGSCEQRNSFTCRFTPTTAMTEQFRFFVQTPCGWKDIELPVTITERSKPETEVLLKKEPKEGAGPESTTGDDTGSEEGSGSNNTVITAVMGCFIIIILIVIMTIIYKTKLNYRKPCGMQKKMLLGEIHDEDNSNCPEDMI